MSNVVASGQITLVDLNDAQSLTLYVDGTAPHQQIYDPNTSAYAPNWATTPVTLTPRMYLTGSANNIIANAKTITWTVNGGAITSGTGGYTIAASKPNPLTISQNVLSSDTPHLTYTCTVVWTDTNFGVDITISADFEAFFIQNGEKGHDGTGSSTAMLDNESATLSVDGNGTINYTNAVTKMSVYVGADDDSANWTYGASPSTGVTGSLGTGAAGSVALRTYTVTSMTVDSGFVDLTASKSGFSPVTKRFTLAKSKSAVAYSIVVDQTVLKRSGASNNTYSPATINLTGKSQSGTANPVNFSGRFTIEEFNGTAWNTVYTSSANENTKAWSPSTANLVAIRCNLHSADVAATTSTILDQQSVGILVDGKDGSTKISAYCWAPNGTSVVNNSGSVIAECDVFNGATDITASASFQWYKYDITVLTDQGAGVNWLKLDATHTGGGCSNYTTYRLTIPAAAIDSMATFKCGATYPTGGGGTIYYDTVSVTDVTDPIQLSLLSDTGRVFKNGQGTKNVTCKVYQGTSGEIDQGGSLYEYRWTLYDELGNADVDFVDYKITDPTAAPTSSSTGTGNTVVAGTYSCVYTWTTAFGETKKSPAKSQIVAAGANLVVTVPALPANVTGCKVYISTTAGSEKLVTTATTAGAKTYTTAIPTNGVLSPATNTASSTYKTGKTITVLNTDVTNQGNLVCEIWK
jgi:hypothetical protein